MAALQTPTPYARSNRLLRAHRVMRSSSRAGVIETVITRTLTRAVTHAHFAEAGLLLSAMNSALRLSQKVRANHAIRKCRHRNTPARLALCCTGAKMRGSSITPLAPWNRLVRRQHSKQSLAPHLAPHLTRQLRQHGRSNRFVVTSAIACMREMSRARSSTFAQATRFKPISRVDSPRDSPAVGVVLRALRSLRTAHGLAPRLIFLMVAASFR